MIRLLIVLTVVFDDVQVAEKEGKRKAVADCAKHHHAAKADFVRFPNLMKATYPQHDLLLRKLKSKVRHHLCVLC